MSTFHVDCIMDKIGAISNLPEMYKQGVIVTQICVVILAVVDVCVKDQRKQWEQYHLHTQLGNQLCS